MTLLLDCLAVTCLTVVCLRCAVCTDNNVTLVVFDYDREPVGIVVGIKAAFGPRVPRRGIQGHLMYTIPSNGCLPVRPPPRSRDWIAIMRRGSCEFSTKVLHAQLQGYVAAIVVNSHSDKLLSMGQGKNASQVAISSVFVGVSDGIFLISNFNRNTRYTIHIGATFHYEKDVSFPLILFFGLLTLIIVISVMASVLGNWVLIRQSRASKVNLSKLPIIKFKTGDPYDTCAICLEDYVDDDSLRVLPCTHAFHVTCIDPWLTRVKRLCPICKRDITPGANTVAPQAGDRGNERTSLLVSPTSNAAGDASESTTQSLTNVDSQEQATSTYGTMSQNDVAVESMSQDNVAVGTISKDNVAVASTDCDKNVNPSPKHSDIAGVTELPGSCGH